MITFYCKLLYYVQFSIQLLGILDHSMSTKTESRPSDQGWRHFSIVCCSCSSHSVIENALSSLFTQPRS